MIWISAVEAEDFIEKYLSVTLGGQAVGRRWAGGGQVVGRRWACGADKSSSNWFKSSCQN